MAKVHGGELQVQPLIVERWPDLERLFGPRGAAGGCWCMWWRLSGRAFARQKGEGNRQALRALVEAGEEPGLIAYMDGNRSAGAPWRPASATPVWSVPARWHGWMISRSSR